MQSPTLTIDLDALKENYAFLQNLKPAAECASVVKANAYGLGITRVAPALYAAGCKSFFVAWAHEGTALRALLGDDVNIYVFNGPTKEVLPQFTANNLIPVLNSPSQIELWRRSKGGSAILHIDTAMNRLGLHTKDLTHYLQNPSALEGLNITHIMSHYACGAEPNNPANLAQQVKFQTKYEELRTLFPNAKASLSASAGLFLNISHTEQLIRPGIALYGGGPQDKTTKRLQPIATLTAPVLQIRNIQKGESVGYGGTFTAQRKSKVATIGIGYADGYLRSLSNKGYVWMDGANYPVVGNVSMDLIGIDITGADHVSEGDNAELFGPNLAIEDVARQADTISYELLAGLAPRVLRKYY